MIAACHWKRNPPMLLTAVVGLAAFYGGHPLLSSPPRLRACVAHHMGDLPHDDEPVKTSQGVDVKVAAAEISRLLREQEAADAAAAAEIFVTDKDVVTSELEAALEATVKAAEEETGAAVLQAAKAKKLWIEQEEARALEAKQLVSAKAAVCVATRTRRRRRPVAHGPAARPTAPTPHPP